MRLLLTPSLIALSLGVTLLTATPTSAQGAGTSRPKNLCKCIPDDKTCWPSDAAWKEFNDKEVNGRLIATTPVASVCHGMPGVPRDEAKCKEVEAGYGSDKWRSNQPGAVMSANWETFMGDGCLLKQTTPCEQGAVPLYTVNATSVDDVVATVKFASKNNLPFVVKNTGHDYLGRSMGIYSLSLWTHFMKSISHNDAFIPVGAPANTKAEAAMILGPGVVWEEAYNYANQHNRLVVGGHHPTVGTSGGFCQSGGHGPLSPLHGLCVDNVLQYKVVIANGTVLDANAYQNQDLFWALRGGGPSYGVVVEAVYRTHPPASFQVALWNITATDEAMMLKISEAYYAHQTRLSAAKWAGYALTRKDHLFMVYHLPNGNEATARNDFAPFKQELEAIGATIDKERYLPMPSYKAFLGFWASISSGRNVGLNLLLGSRLIPSTMLSSREGSKQLATTMYGILKATQPNTKEYLSMLVTGGQVAKANAAETSVHPGWRTAGLFNVIYGGWADSTPLDQQKEFATRLTTAVDELRKITPGAGTYMNEADANEPDFKDAFFGSNYQRLLEIKNKYDPQSLFYCRKCVGSDEWDALSVCRM
ncbi:hypothetical protein DFQ26_002211 [Actinomortierella ambigua]|nr:hypothetical protein DFQ26_002211 [Actinomortierella ambigua]